jgi:hypothetical protein
LHIGRIDLTLEACSRILCFRALLRRNRKCRQNAYNTTCATPSRLQRAGRLGSAMRGLPQAPGDECDVLDLEQDWADHWPISRSSVSPRRAGDCMMNEPWFDDPAVITGDVTFARTKWKHMSNLRAAFCCKIGVQFAYLALELGDWPDCVSNASIYQQVRHSERSAPSAGVWRADISYTGPGRFISRQPTAVASGKTGVRTKPVQFRHAGAHRLPLKPLDSPRWTSHTYSTGFLSAYFVS